MTACPRCRRPGRPVRRVTLQAQIHPDRLDAAADGEGWRLCRTASCEVVYFRGGDVIGLDEVRTRPYREGDGPERRVCFCFGHTVGAIEADARGASTIPASIRAACREGRNDCARKNPSGRCCLGDVARIADRASHPDDQEEDACCPPTKGPLPRSARRLAPAGALVSAALSSACCWLPLAALGLGVSTGGAAAALSAWRIPLLLASAGFLAVYLVGRSRSPCVPPGRWRRDRLLAGATIVLVAGFALFPEAIGALSGADGEIAVRGAHPPVRYRIGGMTCAGCEGHVRSAIEAIPGVLSAAVSYRDGRAEVRWRGPPDDDAVVRAIGALGYRAERDG